MTRRVFSLSASSLVRAFRETYAYSLFTCTERRIGPLSDHKTSMTNHGDRAGRTHPRSAHSIQIGIMPASSCPDSISRAGQHQPQKPIKTAANKKTRGKTATPETSPQPQAQAAAPGPTNTAQNIPAPAPTAAPIMVRIASVVTNADGKRRDLPYGVPVPNRAGFVTSPYAPNQGWVDVRGIASGTEVKDPYTGKTFLTP